jgi:hypothetical protein
VKRLLVLVFLVGCDQGGLTPRTPRTPPPTASAAPVVAPPAKPRTYDDQDGQFSIQFPLPFEVERASGALGGGTMVTTSVSTSTDNPLYIALKVNLENITSYDCEKGLDGMRDQTMLKVGCTPTDEKRFEVKGNAAREVSFSCTKRRGIMLLICDATKGAAKRYTVYEIAASGATMTDDVARQFTSSFTLK